MDNTYFKPKNEIFARHTLITKRQVAESIDQYLQLLKQMREEFYFKAVSADEKDDEFIRDSFISGLFSSN